MSDNIFFNSIITGDSYLPEPLSYLTTSYDGHLLYSTVDIIYGQVIINPKTIDFGQITFDDSKTFELWNASADYEYLESIEKIGFDGLNLAGIQKGYLAPGQSYVYKYDVSAEGGKDLNARAIFKLQNGNNTDSFVTGSRIVFFANKPDYTGQNVVNYSYRTEIQQFYNGDEERHPIYVNSDMMISNSYILNGQEARKVKSLLQNFGTESFFVPAYQNYEKLLFDVNIGENEIIVSNIEVFESGQLLMIGEYGVNNTQINILDVDYNANKLILENPISASFKAGEHVYPIYNSMFRDNGNNINKKTGDVITCTLSMKVYNLKENLKTYNSIVIDQYEGIDVLTRLPDSRDSNMSFDFLFEDFQDFGALERIKQMTKADNIISFQYKSDKEEIDYIKKFFYRQQGKLKEFYVPSFYNDMVATRDIQAVDASITIENSGHSAFNASAEKREHLILRLKDGRIILKKIYGFNALNSNEETVLVGESFGETIKVEDIKQISFLYKARFSSDTLSISYYNYDFAEINLSFKTL